MPITYAVNADLSTDALREILESSGLPRPVGDPGRLERRSSKANLAVTAWDQEGVVGGARALTDFASCA
jgi:hypothetical protein